MNDQEKVERPKPYIVIKDEMGGFDNDDLYRIISILRKNEIDFEIIR